MQPQPNLFDANCQSLLFSFEIDETEDLTWFWTDMQGETVHVTFERKAHFLSVDRDTWKPASEGLGQQKSVKLQQAGRKLSDDWQQRLLESSSTCNNSEKSESSEDLSLDIKNMQRLIYEEKLIIRQEIENSFDLNELVGKYTNDDMNEFIDRCPIQSKTKPIKYRKSKSQVKILEDYFSKNKMWSKEDWQIIAAQSGLTSEAVYKWNHYMNSNPKKSRNFKAQMSDGE